MNKNSITPMNLQLFANGEEDESYNIGDEAVAQKLMEMFGAEEGQEEMLDQGLQGEPVEGELPQEEGELPPEEGELPQEEGELPPGDDAMQDPTDPEGQDPEGEGMILGKFKTLDDLANAYQNLESYMTQTRQELAQTKELANQLQSMAQSQQNQLDIEQQPVAEDEEVDDTDFMELFYSDPKAALRQVIEETVKPEIDPLKRRFEAADRQEQWAAKINEFSQQVPDLDQYQEAMADVFVQHPELMEHPNGMQFAYDIAKGREGVQDPNTLLQDDDFVNQNIVNNPEIRDKIIQEYLAEIQGGTPPASIGTTPAGGQIPMTPPKKPTNMEEASAMALEYFKK